MAERSRDIETGGGEGLGGKTRYGGSQQIVWLAQAPLQQKLFPPAYLGIMVLANYAGTCRGDLAYA